jgi:hypothetical protein
MVKFLEWFFKFCVSLFFLLPIVCAFFPEAQFVQTMEAMLHKVVVSEITWGKILILGLPVFGSLCLVIISVVKKEIRRKAEEETEERLKAWFEADCAEALVKGILIGEYNHLIQRLKEKSKELQQVLSLHQFSYGENKTLFLSQYSKDNTSQWNIFFISGPDGIIEKIDLLDANFNCSIPDGIHTTDKGYEIGQIKLIKIYDTSTLKRSAEISISNEIDLVKQLLIHIEMILKGNASVGQLIRNAVKFGLVIEKRFIGKPPETKIVLHSSTPQSVQGSKSPDETALDPGGSATDLSEHGVD